MNPHPLPKPRSYRQLWISLIAVIGLSFLVLGYFGSEIYRLAPPMPKRVVTTDGAVLFTAQDIKDGQNVWQSIGGQEVGTIWGHGAYVAPDWTADWLHREATWLLSHWAAQSGSTNYEQLPAETQAALRARLKQEIRSNTYNPETGDLVVSPTARGGDPGGGRSTTPRCSATTRACASCARAMRFRSTPSRRRSAGN